MQHESRESPDTLPCFDSSLLRPRRVQQKGDLTVCTGEKLMIVDSGCDQTIVNHSSFLIGTYTGVFINVGGALISHKPKYLEIVNDCYTFQFKTVNLHKILEGLL